jgi:hypothetical protein
VQRAAYRVWIPGERREFKAPGSTTDATTGSSDDTVAQVGDARGFEHPDKLECGLTRLEPVEQALTRTEYHRVDLEIDLIY